MLMNYGTMITSYLSHIFPKIATINDGGLATESKTEFLSLDECTLGNSFDRCATSGAFVEGFPRKAFPFIILLELGSETEKHKEYKHL